MTAKESFNNSSNSKPDKQNSENLRRNALLNSLTTGIDYLSKLGVGFILSKIIIVVLGPIYYGAWQVISQLNSYMSTADVQAGTSLRFVLARNRTVASDDELRRSVSSALYSNFFFLPLYFIIGIVVVWYAPIMAGVDVSYFKVVRVATAFLVQSFLITQFFFLYESTLHGMNLAYKRIGQRAAINILGGVLTAVTLYMGYGIVGMAVAQVAISTATGLSFLYVVKRQIPWFRFVKVKTAEVMLFVKQSVWFMLQKIVSLLNNSIDMILLGYFAGPKYVAAYAITKYAMISGSNLIKTVMTSATIGLGKYIGEERYDKIADARSQFLLSHWIYIIVSGVMVCLFNRSFVFLWIGPDYFSGQTETFLIIAISLLAVLNHFDSSIINVTLNLKKKIIYSFVSAIIIIGSAAVLTPMFQTLGMLIAILTGTFFTTCNNALLAGRMTANRNVFTDLFFSRIAGFGILVLIATNFLSLEIFLSTWLELIAAMILTGIIAVTLIWFLFMTSNNRNLILTTIKKINLFNK